jgi:hypothetical protein
MNDPYPVRTPVLCRGIPGLIASAPIPNPDGSVSYYVKENARARRFLGIFKVLEPGAEEPVNGGESIDCVIVTSHPMNIRWGTAFGERGSGEPPVCRSVDGVEGIDEGGEVHACSDCPYNRFGEDGQRKACTNKRQLYVFRAGDLFPMLFALPPSGLRAFDNYRVRTRLTVRQPMHAIVTRISLAQKRNDAGVAYSAPVFTPVGLLPQDGALQVKAYVESIVNSVKKAGIFADDLTGAAAAQAEPADDTARPADEDIPDCF